MQKKKQILILVLISSLVLISLLIFIILKYPPSQSKNEFTGEMQDAPAFLQGLNLQQALEACNKEEVLDPVLCYRLLAIQHPENKEEICSNIKESLCARTYANSNCLEQIDLQKESCLSLFPLRG